jgi:integrase
MKKAIYTFASVLAEEMESYLLLRQSQGHQVQKERQYLVTLDRFLQQKSVNEKNLTTEIVEGWLQSLPTEMHVNTRIVYISHFSQFARYLQTLRIPAFIPERPVADQIYVPYIFSQDEIRRLIDAVDCRVFEKEHDKTARLQFPVILRLLCGCGLRLDEALLLRTGNMDLDAGVLRVRGGKGSKDRLVPMDDSLRKIFCSYFSVAEKTCDKDALVFENSKGQRRAQSWARIWFNYALTATDIQKPELPRFNRNICLHCLRHTFAVESLRKQDHAGIDSYDAMPVLSTYMGHSDTGGTEHYLHMTAETSQDILDRTQDYTTGLFPEVPV